MLIGARCGGILALENVDALGRDPKTSNVRSEIDDVPSRIFDLASDQCDDLCVSEGMRMAPQNQRTVALAGLGKNRRLLALRLQISRNHGVRARVLVGREGVHVETL